MTCTLPSVAQPTTRGATLDVPRHHRAQEFVCSVLALAVLVGLGCSSSAPAGEQWTASYVEPPDRVWAAINQTLEDLGYEIEQADRHESIIVARSSGDESDPPMTLRIAQVARTEVVRVHVTPASATSDDERFTAAAGEFLATLDAAMKGSPPENESKEN